MKVKITVLKRALHEDLSAKYENPIEHACDMTLGDVFLSDGTRPEGFCESAWQSVGLFVERLAKGEGYFYGNWMKNPYSAMISCNDGFRPVSFYLERIED